MVFLGAGANALAIAIGGALGSAVGKFLSDGIKETLMGALGLSVVFVGLDGTLSEKGINALVVMLSLALGGLIGAAFDFEGRLSRVCAKLAPKRSGDHFAEGFLTCTMVTCIGAMAVVGAIESGMRGNHSIYYIKSILDAVFVFITAASLGRGCMFSALSVLIYEGTLSLLAASVASLLSDAQIGAMSVVGSVVILAIGLNQLGATKIPIANLMLAPFIPIVLLALQNAFL